MPCRYDDYDYPAKGMVNREALDHVTRMACNLAKVLEDVVQDHEDYNWNEDALSWVRKEQYIDQETYDWVINHRKADEERKQKLREVALKKLTDEEKEALGL